MIRCLFTQHGDEPDVFPWLVFGSLTVQVVWVQIGLSSGDNGCEKECELYICMWM